MEIGFVIKNPISITTEQYGNLEINSPLGVIKSQLPDVYNMLKGTSAENVFNLNLIDARPLVNYPIDKWNTLFTLNETTGNGYLGQKVAVTEFIYKQSDLSQGSLRPINTAVNFTVDSNYRLTTTENTSSGIIDVEGKANGDLEKGYPVISTTTEFKVIDHSEPQSLWALYVFFIFLIIIGGLVYLWIFFKRRKNKSVN
jgi:hypothetical protein